MSGAVAPMRKKLTNYSAVPVSPRRDTRLDFSLSLFLVSLDVVLGVGAEGIRRLDNGKRLKCIQY